MTLEKFKDRHTSRRMYESDVIQMIELSASILLALGFSDGNYYILPPKGKKLAEPRFYITVEVLVEPAFLPWIQVLQYLEIYIATRMTGSNASVEQPQNPIPEEVPPEAIQEMHLDPESVSLDGTPLAVFSKEDGCVDHNQVVEGKTLPQWIVHLQTYNRFYESPHKKGWLMAHQSTSLMEDLLGISVDRISGRLNEIRGTSLVSTLRFLSQFYGCPAIDPDMYFMIGRTKFRTSSLCLRNNVFRGYTTVDPPLYLQTIESPVPPGPPGESDSVL
jgi:hypothetical protein